MCRWCPAPAVAVCMCTVSPDRWYHINLETEWNRVESNAHRMQRNASRALHLIIARDLQHSSKPFLACLVRLILPHRRKSFACGSHYAFHLFVNNNICSFRCLDNYPETASLSSVSQETRRRMAEALRCKVYRKLCEQLQATCKEGARLLPANCWPRKYS